MSTIVRLTANLSIQLLGDYSGAEKNVELTYVDIDSSLCDALFTGYGGGFFFNPDKNALIDELFKWYSTSVTTPYAEFAGDLVQLLRFMVVAGMKVDNYLPYRSAVTVEKTTVARRENPAYNPPPSAEA